ncbi:hypothetical protein GCM10010967_02500 [Dyadobacter beijingensis]|uniref:Secreted protein (Por secretion system target) n=1 Tax=Dyadobacter beijingensis TaxID=365489 RepID=A0ABQ2HBI9_9BACT|nr:hypothetical protein [Dyadobacter beijingensis]GGM74557.1 hypothetical protein GCM10010967_02500 [Dyadobacter beijingensis]
MKRDNPILTGSTATIVAVLLFVFNAHANDPFHVKWTMDYTQAGISDHANFAPAGAQLAGGPNTFTLPTVYSSGGGAIGTGYIVRPWPTTFSSGRYMEFSFSAGALKYNITSISFRLRRSPNGPNGIKIRTGMDGFAADLNAFTISNNGVFNSYSIPVSYGNLSGNTFTLRIYAYNPVDIYGTLWFDEISINGDVQAIILPVDLIYFKGEFESGRVALNWETAWEKSSKEFVIERSADMRNFGPVGAVAASGETAGRTSYAFTDNDPAAGNNYYRLRLVDRDGSFTTCKPVAVFAPEPISRIYVAPNPASPHTVTLHAPDGHNAFLALHSESGISVPFRRENGPDGRIFLKPYRPLPSGIYFVVYVNNTVKEELKVLVP